jgi:hypothetical protein
MSSLMLGLFFWLCVGILAGMVIGHLSRISEADDAACRSSTNDRPPQ